jgi:hypothetical protein
VSIGPVLPLPVLAAVPMRPLPAWSGVLLAVPLAAGMIAGWLLRRRQVRSGAEPGWLASLAPAALAGPVAGALIGLAAVASRGPIGSGRLAEVGPAAWPLAGIAAAVTAAGATVAVAALRALAARTT